MAEAHAVVDRFDEHVTRGVLDEALAQQTNRLASLWRRDLLLILTGQFVALAGVLTAIG